MMSFFIKSSGNVLKTAAKTSLIDTARGMSGVGIVLSGYYIYNRTASLLNQYSLFKNRSNKLDIQEVLEKDTYISKSSFSD
ncbi:hypothetical protein Lgra_2368 [Legionella gratiana]|uniref:Uncharacterized protein n=1 Tax=Legionella gratiana TaxID=45066 RepID=A0A378JCW7_9GAMM|nr:hypothetical protein [Legionella gratiana]KTD09133.1 hypothetical protein Lgra_2368 [Legionella gratiana]STX45653.1 Uncharacterised protein [Legionella gratiana]